MTDVIGIARRDGVAVLTFRREARRNALSVELARGIVDSMAELDADDRVRGMSMSSIYNLNHTTSCFNLTKALAMTKARATAAFCRPFSNI